VFLRQQNAPLIMSVKIMGNVQINSTLPTSFVKFFVDIEGSWLDLKAEVALLEVDLKTMS
jgi:hypothetical protein